MEVTHKKKTTIHNLEDVSEHMRRLYSDLGDKYWDLMPNENENGLSESTIRSKFFAKDPNKPGFLCFWKEIRDRTLEMIQQLERKSGTSFSSSDDQGEAMKNTAKQYGRVVDCTRSVCVTLTLSAPLPPRPGTPLKLLEGFSLCPKVGPMSITAALSIGHCLFLFLFMQASDRAPFFSFTARTLPGFLLCFAERTTDKNEKESCKFWAEIINNGNGEKAKTQGYFQALHDGFDFLFPGVTSRVSLVLHALYHQYSLLL